MRYRHLTLLALLGLAIGGCATMNTHHENTPGTATFLSEQDMEFLKGMTVDVLKASLVKEGESVGGAGPNITGGPLIRPGGRNAYPAFWIRDYAMALDAGFMPEDWQEHMLRLTARHQQLEQIHLASGSLVTPGAIPDHITFGGKPIFYPGVLDDFEGQGGEQWGKIPCLDDAYYFIHMVHTYVVKTGDTMLLRQDFEGVPLLDRLELAFNMPPSDKSGVVAVSEEYRGVNFGFYDTVVHTGGLLYATLLKVRAADEIGQLLVMAGKREEASIYLSTANALKHNIPLFFRTDNAEDRSGMLRASTEKSAQRDVWGTAFAVYLDVMPKWRQINAAKSLAEAYKEGTLAWRGNIRHVATDEDFSDATAWEVAYAQKNTYQNGAYWGAPAGWVCYAIAMVDIDAARKLANEYIEELREGDFRKGPEYGSPWECMHPDNDHRQNPVYLATVAVPYAAFKRINDEVAEGMLPLPDFTPEALQSMKRRR